MENKGKQAVERIAAREALIEEKAVRKAARDTARKATRVVKAAEAENRKLKRAKEVENRRLQNKLKLLNVKVTKRPLEDQESETKRKRQCTVLFRASNTPPHYKILSTTNSIGNSFSKNSDIIIAIVLLSRARIRFALDITIKLNYHKYKIIKIQDNIYLI